MVRFRGVVNVNGRWVAEFSAGYRVAILPKKSRAREELWKVVRARFIERGIPLIPVTADDDPVVAEVPPSGATA